MSIEPAAAQAGRLDHTVRIDPPNGEAIVQILRSYLGEKWPRAQLQRLARRLKGKTGADIERLVRTAKGRARRAGIAISPADLEASIPDPVASMTAQMRRRLSVYRAGQLTVARVLDLTQMGDEVDEDIVRAITKPFREERFATEQDLNDALAAILAGRAAEEIVFGSASVFGGWSAGSDLAVATELARQTELGAGFGETGVAYAADWQNLPAAAVLGSVRRRLEQALARASSILLENRGELDHMALIEHREVLRRPAKESLH